jgi:sensor histidine kinase YesM
VAGELAQTLVLTDGEGVIADFNGGSLAAEHIGRNLSGIPALGTQTAAYVLADGQVLLHLRIKSVIVWNQTRIMMAVSLAVIVVTLAFGALIVHYVRREMVAPLNRMTEDMRRIDGGEHTLRIRDEYGTQEFTQLRDTFNRLMDVIVHLKIESYEKRIALHEMELKSIRLQLKPHFFLNAISTISSLSSQGRDAEIRTYVDALSRNIRYMFKSGLHTVPVGEEIRHIENYLEMQECRYPGCIFHFIDLPQTLQEWPVPRMLVQTFVENEFKYAVSVDSVLTLLIHISKETFGGQEMLLIRIEDDGKGYPQDVLRYMNGDMARPNDDGERVGLWSIKRMMALMYERDDLVELQNIEPHGCLNLIRIPALPVNEYREMPPDGSAAD